VAVTAEMVTKRRRVRVMASALVALQGAHAVFEIVIVTRVG
jgi:hypothetical protein